MERWPATTAAATAAGLALLLAAGCTPSTGPEASPTNTGDRAFTDRPTSPEPALAPARPLGPPPAATRTPSPPEATLMTGATGQKTSSVKTGEVSGTSASSVGR